MKRIRIPADVDREDQLLAGLSARQLAIAAVAGVICWVIYTATKAFLPPVLIAGVCAPIVATATVLIIVRLDGLRGDRLVAAFMQHALRPRAHVVAPEGVTRATGATKRVVPLNIGIQSFSDDGVIQCGDSDIAICAASSVAFRLRTETEQEALTAAFGRFLNGLAHSLQIAIHVEHLDLHDQVEQLHIQSAALPHLSLQEAAREHAQFLQSLADRPDVVRRRVFLVLRADIATGTIGEQVHSACDAMAAAGIRVQPLTGPHTAALLESATGGGQHGYPDSIAMPDAVIRGGGV